MAYINSHGYAVVDTNPNFIPELQSNHNIKIAISVDGEGFWNFVESNPNGAKWKVLGGASIDILNKDNNTQFTIEDTVKFNKYFDFNPTDKELSLLPKEINNDDERVIKATYNPTSSVQANTNASTGENTEAETFFNLVNNSVFGNGGLAILEYIGNLSSWGLSPYTGTVPSRIYLELYLTTTNSLFATSAGGSNPVDKILLMTVDIFSNGISNDIGLLEQRIPIVTSLQGFTEATSSWSTIEFSEIYNDGSSITKTNKAYFLRTLANDGTRSAENINVRIVPKLILEYTDPTNTNGNNMPYYGRVDNYTTLIRKIR